MTRASTLAAMLSPATARPQIFINGRFLAQRVTGVQRYARETLFALDRLLADGEGPDAAVTLLVPRGTQPPKLNHIAVEQKGALSGHLWEQLELPWYARAGALLNFGFTGPVAKTDQLITIHDAAVVRTPGAYSRRFRAWYRFVVGVIAARAPMVLTVSGFSASEATTCFGVAPDRLRVMSEGWQHLERVQPDMRILDRHGLRGTPFALAVSSPTPNKNFGAIASAIGLLGEAAPRCVVVGAIDTRIFRHDESAEALLHVGYVSDAELKALYQHASCFIFPSFYEGFGIPPLEAMACGCPVIASTAQAVREVCGEAAIYFDPSSPRQLARRIRALFADSALQARLRAAGLCRAGTFSWRRAAQLNVAALREMVGR